MKTIKEIEEEYESYEIKTDVVTSLDEFLSFIEIGIDDTDEYKKSYEKEIRDNNREKLLTKIQNFFYFIAISTGVDFYDRDNEILTDCISYTILFKRFYERIRGIANEDNFLELTRLVDFSCDYYYDQTDYYDYLRNSLELCSRGISMFDPNKKDSRESFTAFMDQKIKEFEKQVQDNPQYKKGR